MSHKAFCQLARRASRARNRRYLEALADVDNPTDAIRALDRITTRKQLAPKRSAKAFNPVARDETQIFRALLSGEPSIRGFSNPDIRKKLVLNTPFNPAAGSVCAMLPFFA